MKKSLAAFGLILFATVPLFAQRDGLDRLEIKAPAEPIPPPPPPLPPGVVAPQAVPPAVEGPDNTYLQLSTTRSDGKVSPKGQFGIRHRDKSHPWFAVAGYSHSAGAASNPNNVSAKGNYQFWTGKESKPDAGDAPYIQFESDYANKLGKNQRLDTFLDGGVTYGAISLDAIAGFSTFKPKDGSDVTDFTPALSLTYSFPSGRFFVLDYSFTNKVDEEAGYDVAYREPLKNGYALDFVVARHNVIVLRLRKDFARFRLGS